MTDSSDRHGPDVTRRRLHFRAWHRGMREMDLLLGSFADTHLGQMSLTELDTFGQLLEESDADLYDWIVGRAPAPPRLGSPVLDLLVKHRLV